jgi:hypothetical protein
MNSTSQVKIECPACGQHYSLYLGDKEETITCSRCNAQFTACREEEEPTVATSITPPRPQTTMSSMSLKRTAFFLDGFMGLLFRFGKTFAGILALVFLLGILLSGLVFVFNLRSSIVIPTYEQIAAKSADDDSGNTTPSGLDQRRELEKKFGDRIAKIIKAHKLDEDLYDSFISVLSRLGKDYRADYLSGLKGVLNDAAEKSKASEDVTLSTRTLIQSYTEAFVDAETTAASAKSSASITRWSAFGSAIICCFMLFMMLVIPALLRIEENTRKTV